MYADPLRLLSGQLSLVLRTHPLQAVFGSSNTERLMTNTDVKRNTRDPEFIDIPDRCLRAVRT